MPTRLPTRAEILDLLGSDERPMHVREIASRLRVSDVDHLGLERLLDSLSLEGVLTARPGPRFRLSAGDGAGDRAERGRSRDAEREGLLTVHPRGFGFVASLTPGTSGDDVFVPPDALGGALHGDKVRVRVRARSARGAEGEIVAILERGIKRVAGTLHRKGKSAWLEPDDTRMRGPIVLPRAIDTDSSAGNSGNDGDAVVVAITRWPESRDENPEGRIESVLGRPGELSVEVAKILVLEKVGEPHSEKAVTEAEAFGEEVPEAMKAGRVDLRHIPLPTIDPEDARDHDDAVWVERTPGGGYRAWIAIADVSTYVTPGTAIDDEARERGCSVYLPDRAIPMLPRALSSNLCSLLPGVDRLCLCVEAEIDAGGHVIDSRILRGVMRSRAKLTYGGVARALGLSSEARVEPEAEAMVDGLRVAYELSRALRAAADEARRARLRAPRGEGHSPRRDARADRRHPAGRRPGREASLPAHRRADAPRQRDRRSVVFRGATRRPSIASTRRPTSRSSTASRACASRSRSISTSRTRATPRSWGTCSSRSRTIRWRPCSTRCSCDR